MATSRRRRQSAPEADAEQGRVVINTQRVKSRMILEEDQREIELDTEVFATDPAFVRVSHGVTKNIGEYESLRCDVAVTLPCYKEAVEETIATLGEFVAKKLEDELAEWGLAVHGEN